MKSCARCGTASDAWRYCEVCGLDFTPDAPLLAIADARDAREREQAWLAANGHLAAPAEPDSAPARHETAIARPLDAALQSSAPGLKVCPDCAEEVKAAARVCRFCGFRFDGQAGDQVPAAPVAAAAIDASRPREVSYRLILMDRRGNEIFSAPFQSPDMAIRHADENPALRLRHTAGSVLLKGAMKPNIVPWKTALILEVDRQTGATSVYHRMEKSVSVLSQFM